MNIKSILREEEYKQVATMTLDGRILDVGGSAGSGYHSLIKGKNNFFVINIDESCKPDALVNIEEVFPFETESFDHSICLNVLEHIFEFNHVFSEQVRCVKSGGKLIFATPFMHHIHASPDDYIRYTDSAYRRLAQKYNCSIECIIPLGDGFFSLGFQTIGGSIPTFFLKSIFRSLAMNLDWLGNKISKHYRRLSSRIPLGYFVVLTKN